MHCDNFFMQGAKSFLQLAIWVSWSHNPGQKLLRQIVKMPIFCYQTLSDRKRLTQGWAVWNVDNPIHVITLWINLYPEDNNKVLLYSWDNAI